MQVEKGTDQIVLRISPKIDAFGIKRIINYIEYLEATAESKATQKDADKLADELNSTWWKENRNRFIK